ncbi:MAG TPA: ABC transporter ATP-binding protein [Rugosimonospora sp.]|nr:ABC transporter ATP-binding protein [Rugosimonospora sp.]
MSDFREEEALGKVYDSHLARRLFRYLRPYRGWVIIAALLTLPVAPLAALGPKLFEIAVDRYFVPSLHDQITRAAAVHGLGWVSLLYLATLALGFAFMYFQVRVMQKVGQDTMYDLRREIFQHLQRLPISFYDRSPVGRLVTRVTTDVDALNDLFATGIAAMVNDALLLVLFIFIMLEMNWKLALATFAVLPLLFLCTWIFRDKVRDANRRIRTAIARINAFLQEHISGMSVVQLFNRERKARAQFAELNRIHMEAYKDAILAFALFYPGVEFLGVVAIIVVFWYGGLRSLAGVVSVGVLIAFMQYAQRFFQPIQDLSEKFNILQSAMAASERIFKLLDEPVPTMASAGLRLSAVRGEIEFRNVWFAYHGGAHPKEDDWVLRDVSFRVRPGETMAIVGHTGAGKTTTIQLLLRFYDIQRGQILLDGTDIRELSVQDLRRQFGIVLQDPFLFTGTLESNVRLGTASVSRKAAESALREVGLGPFLDSLPQGLDTMVSERGSTFSVGQRQLVSFARALAHNPRFLILDEATSSVDTRTEMMIREALDRLLTGRTSIAIAHRLSTIQNADRILVFHKGRLREQGTHQELLLQRGIYYRLYQLQYKDQELRFPVAPAGSAGAPLPADD